MFAKEGIQVYFFCEKGPTRIVFSTWCNSWGLSEVAHWCPNCSNLFHLYVLSCTISVFCMCTCEISECGPFSFNKVFPLFVQSHMLNIPKLLCCAWEDFTKLSYRLLFPVQPIGIIICSVIFMPWFSFYPIKSLEADTT